MIETLSLEKKSEYLFPKIYEYVSKLETADTIEKIEIENKLVSIGEDALPSLVDSLQFLTGKTRGIIAMVLIRIGNSSVDYLKRAAKTNSEFEWIAKYLITEIEGVAA